MPKLALPTAFLTLAAIVLFGNFRATITAAVFLLGLILWIIGRRAIVHIHVLGQNGVTLLYATAVPAAREEASSAINSYTRFAAKSAVVAPAVS